MLPAASSPATFSSSLRFLPSSLRTGRISPEVLASAEQLGKLERHVRRELEKVAGELAAGNITADPFWRGEHKNACQWCRYADACQFREGVGGDGRRWLPTVKAEEFWAHLDRDGE